MSTGDPPFAPPLIGDFPQSPFTYPASPATPIQPNRVGWTCPKCSTVHSPDVKACVSCKPVGIGEIRGVGTGPQLLNEG